MRQGTLRTTSVYNLCSWLRRAPKPLVHALAAANRLIHQRDIIGDGRIAGILGLRLGEFYPRPAEIAAQHVRVADVVDDFRPRSEDRERLGIGAVGKFVALEPIVGGREPEPRFAVARRFFNRAAE